ncbi:MAG: fibronectin type III domain-containing protein, partial [bacterium]
MFKFKKNYLRVLLIAAVCLLGLGGFIIKSQANDGELNISDVAVSNIKPTEATITWHTNSTSTTEILIWEGNKKLEDQLFFSRTLGENISQSVVVTNLKPLTLYTYQIIAYLPEQILNGINSDIKEFTTAVGEVATGKDETYYSTNLKTDRKLYQAPEKIILELWSYSKNSNVSSDSYFVDIWLTKILKKGTIEKELIESAFKVSTHGFSSFKEINITQNDYFNKNGSGEYAIIVCKVNTCSTTSNGNVSFNSNSSPDATFTVIMPTVSELIISNLQVPTSLIRPTEATLTWVTNVPSNSDVHYWSVDKTQENWNWDKIDDCTQTNHSITLKDLKPFTTYYFTVSSNKKIGEVKT